MSWLEGAQLNAGVKRAKRAAGDASAAARLRCLRGIRSVARREGSLDLGAIQGSSRANRRDTPRANRGADSHCPTPDWHTARAHEPVGQSQIDPNIGGLRL